MTKGLERLKGKVIRYWMKENENGECYRGRLLGYDKYGVLFVAVDIEPKDAKSPLGLYFICPMG